MSRNGNRKLRIGIIGAGGIVKRRHLPAFKRRSDVEIVAISNSTYESAEKFCQENVPTAIPIANWPDLVALPDIDIVWIGTPPYMHSAVTVSALEAGKQPATGAQRQVNHSTGKRTQSPGVGDP